MTFPLYFIWIINSYFSGGVDLDLKRGCDLVRSANDFQVVNFLTSKSEKEELFFPFVHFQIPAKLSRFGPPRSLTS